MCYDAVAVQQVAPKSSGISCHGVNTISAPQTSYDNFPQRRARRENESRDHEEALGMYPMFLPLLMLAGGLFAGLTAFAAELCCARPMKGRKKKTTTTKLRMY